MGLRVCFVTPFVWSQPHDVNDHVAGVARELRASVTPSPCWRRPTAPWTSARDVERCRAESSARSWRSARRFPFPAGARWPRRSACARTSRSPWRTARFDVVHGFEPGVPSLSYLALRDTHALASGDVLLARPALLSPGQGAARTAAGPDRRAARDVGGDGGRGRPALPGRLHRDLARGRSRPLPPGQKKAEHRRGARPRRARGRAHGDP